MDKIKRIPYGKGDFEAVNAEGRYYVDKTMFIPELEKTDYVFLIRPRRFGKTLFLSTLQSYYDINKKDRFDEFYRDTWIHRNPTDERAKYMILYFNFSVVRKDINLVQQSFNDYCVNQITWFARKYAKRLPPEFVPELGKLETGHEKLQLLASGLPEGDTKLFLMIDEYDNFTNTIISEHGSAEYDKVTHGSGYYRDFFAALKGIASGSGSALARMFITGVSPVTMDDVTSGFNIGDNVSLNDPLSTAFGFTEAEVEEMLDYYVSVGEFPVDKTEALQVMRKWYGNYRFSEGAAESVFNTDMVLYFVKRVLANKREPRQLIDDNVRTDYGKLRHLIALDKRGRKTLNGNFDKLKSIIEDDGIEARLRTSFPHEKIIDRDNFISLLYFLGLLTHAGERRGRAALAIPNETIRSMIYGYLREALDDTGAFAVDVYELEERMSNMAYKGEWQEVFRFIGEEIKRQTKVRDYIQGEKVIQAFFLAYLNICDFYLSLSEEERSKGYADLVLKPFTAKYPDMPYAYLLEFKYIPRIDDQAALAAKIAEKRKESEAQLVNYANDDFAKKMMKTAPYGDVQLKKGVIIFNGWELVVLEDFDAD